MRSPLASFCRPSRMRPARWAAAVIALGAVGCSLGVCAPACGQQRAPIHYFQSAELPPGTVAAGQLLRGGPLPGYFQPVEIKVPPGAAVSVAANGEFQPSQKDSALVSMLIGPVYSLKVIGIARYEGQEVFPTIEVINRLYPPPGLAARFPIQIHFTTEELQLALSGQFVTRVIYLENPNDAPGVRDTADFQRYFEVRSDEEPLQVADRLGRPMAILRMGSRVPDVDGTGRMLVATPPLMLLQKPGPLPDMRSGLEPSLPAAPRMPMKVGQ